MWGLEAEWLPIQASSISMNVTGDNINILSEKTFGYVQTKACVCVGKILLKDGL